MSMNAYSLNPEAQEFSVSSLDLNTSWNLGANDFVPFAPPPPAIAHEEHKELPKPQKRIYSFSDLFSLRDLHKSLPAGVVIPELYSKHHISTKSKKKHPVHVKEAPKDPPIKRAESIFVSSSILVKTEHPFTEKVKKTATDLEKKSREIRCILNKLTTANFDKLCKTLVTDFTYSEELLTNLANFLFERATALNFPELYSQLCRRLRTEFKAINLSTPFRVAIVEKCRESFYREDQPLEGDKLMETEYKRRRRLIGNIRFIALLHKEAMIKSEIMYECFDVLLDPKSLSEETLETCITLFKDTCPLLVSGNPEMINQYYDRLVAFMNNPQFSTRINFMIQDLIETKDKIMVPRTSKVIRSPTKNTPTKVSKAVFREVEAEEVEVKVEKAAEAEAEVEVEQAVMGDECKNTIKYVTKIYANGGATEDWMPSLTKTVQENFRFHVEIIVQVLKYGLYEFYKDHLIENVCKLVMVIVKDYNLEQDVIGKAIGAIENDLDEIKTDSPGAGSWLLHMKGFFKIA